MAVIILSSISPISEVPAFEYRLSNSSGNSDTLIIPAGLRRGVSVILEVSSGSGKLQYSTSPRYLHQENATTVVWMDWTNGVIAATDDNQFGPISAIRIVTTSGTQVLHLQAD